VVHLIKTSAKQLPTLRPRQPTWAESACRLLLPASIITIYRVLLLSPKTETHFTVQQRAKAESTQAHQTGCEKGKTCLSFMQQQQPGWKSNLQAAPIKP